MELPLQPEFTRVKRTVSFPGEAEEMIQKRLNALNLTFSQYVESLVLYDLMLEKPHMLTGDSARAGGETLWAEWREVAAGFGKEKDLRSLFEAKLSLIAQRAKPTTV